MTFKSFKDPLPYYYKSQRTEQKLAMLTADLFCFLNKETMEKHPSGPKMLKI